MSKEAVETELWLRYRSQQDQDARDHLYLRHAPWAATIAKEVHRRVWAYQVDREDFIQNATIGLLEAMSRYEPERGIAFRAYAKPRVRGAVFNGLRSILGDRIQAQDESRFISRLEHLQVGDEGEGAFERVVESIVGLGIGYLLDEARNSSSTEPADGLAYVHATELESRVLSAVEQLPERVRWIVHAHYYQHVPFQEIASSLGLTKGRVSQLHRSALLKLRELLREP